MGYQYTASEYAAGQYLQQQQSLSEYEALGEVGGATTQDPRFMTQEDKDRGLGSVFKRDDHRLQQLREKDSREKDPTFISESYSECYPGYQEYNREVVESDEEADLSKMDMGARVSSLDLDHNVLGFSIDFDFKGQGAAPPMGLRHGRGVGGVQRAEGSDAQGGLPVRGEDAGREEDEEAE